jgi:acyl-CoA synthetase (AMP-forming)/AMP-acid ligase II
MRYMEGVMDWVRTNPDKTVLFDTEADKAMSYGELDRLTSGIYAYLADRGSAGKLLS